MGTIRPRTPQGSRLLLVLAMVAALVGCTRQSTPAPPAPERAAVTASTAPAVELAPVARAGRGEAVVTLFHETHIYGMLLGREQPSGAAADGRTFAHFMGLLDQQRRRLEAGASLVLGNGDDLSDELPVPAVLGGGTVSTGGRHAVEVFSAAGMDANTFGFNELDYVLNQTDRFRELVARSRFT